MLSSSLIFMSNLIQQNILLKDYSNFKIGGPARYFLEFKSLEELKAGLAEWEEIKESGDFVGEKVFIISGATNILFNDAGFDGLILHNTISLIKDCGDGILEIGAGTSISELNRYCTENSFSGTEWSGGLPGSVGGAIFGNAGAFGGEIKDTVSEVISFDYLSGETIRRNNSDCEFNYRDSVFKSKELSEIIISAKFQLKNGNHDEIAAAIDKHIDYRKRKQPLEYPNIGSIFKNVPVGLAGSDLIEKTKEKIKNDPFPVIPTAYLIFLAGLVGYKVGGAQISEKHPNMIINATGQATAADVKKLIAHAQKTIAEKFQVHLEPEVRILSEDGQYLSHF